ncbi:uncharacterized protein LOC133532935 [Cydia pomonella]|uniref:uncharacterized protein LOC133532935 n=1 Tax=Cydia pomonella TaxID=82600 RepID=UPI002ADDA516|nr:uncharacterized protein LOC133532935 [Cydia pomonella]XP_061727792.1 uncharacterized protein LOC133532935 [Cydia pomonella]
MPYTRPPATPTVWHRFTARGVTLRVQDLTPDLYELAITLLRTYFTRDEPPCKYIGIEKYPSAMHELEQLWRKTLNDNVSLVCVTDDGVVVGANVLAVVCKEDKDEPFQTHDKIWGQLFGAVDLVSRGVDIFEKYGVDKYLTAYGLVVDPEWRGLGVAKEILKARISLCRSLRIKVTATVFTARASQIAAKKAGFEDLYEMTYEELAKKGCVFPGVEEDTKSSKLMALVIDEN